LPSGDTSQIGSLEPVIRVYFTEQASGNVFEADWADVTINEAHVQISVVAPALAGDVAISVDVAHQRHTSVVSTRTSSLTGATYTDGRDDSIALGIRYAPPSFEMRGDTSGSTVGGVASGAVIELVGSGFGRQYDQDGNEIGWVTVGGVHADCFQWNDTLI